MGTGTGWDSEVDVGLGVRGCVCWLEPVVPRLLSRRTLLAQVEGSRRLVAIQSLRLSTLIRSQQADDWEARKPNDPVPALHQSYRSEAADATRRGATAPLSPALHLRLFSTTADAKKNWGTTPSCAKIKELRATNSSNRNPPTRCFELKQNNSGTGTSDSTRIQKPHGDITSHTKQTQNYG